MAYRELAAHHAVDAARRRAAGLRDVEPGERRRGGSRGSRWSRSTRCGGGGSRKRGSSASPGPPRSLRWGRYWAVGSALGGALWGLAAVVVFPASEPHQALLIVCLFGVALGGLNLTAVWRPSFYGFVLPALVPLIVRVAWEGDPVHLDTAVVMTVVLAFVLAFGHRVNDLLTQALAMRHENVDLIARAAGADPRGDGGARAAEAANRAKSQLLAAASHDLRQPLHAVGLFVSALAARTVESGTHASSAASQQSLDALDAQFGQLIDLSRLEAGALAPDRARVPLAPLFAALAAEFAAAGRGEGAPPGRRAHATRRRQRSCAARPRAAQPRLQRSALHPRGRRGRSVRDVAAPRSRSTSSTPASGSRTSIARASSRSSSRCARRRPAADAAWGSGSPSCAASPTCSGMPSRFARSPDAGRASGCSRRA